jgi:glycosyltransferase involved in cell wall biosynthesis
LKDKSLDCQVLVVGRDSGFLGELKKLAIKLNLQDKVIFTGPISEEDLISAYFASDIFVLLSEHEGFGIVVIEAMAGGLPILASNRGSLPYVEKKKKNGLLSEYGNPKDINEKLKILLKSDIIKEKFSKSAKEKAKNYDWNRIVKMYGEIYTKNGK